MARKGADRDRLLATFPSSIRRTFDLMEIAEEEIAAAKARAPEEARARLHRAFAVLAPGGALAGYPDFVYRAHARELLGRVQRGEDTRPGTAAEAMIAISRASLVAPPGAQVGALFERLFTEVRGAPLPGVPIAAPWGGASEELLADLRRRLTDPRRVLP
jgi:hypothetical protein